MKYLLPNMIWLLLFSMILSLTSGGLYAQRSVAELISVMPPPKDRVEYKDGVRQINILNDHLFVTNFWAGLQVVDISDIKNPRQTAVHNLRSLCAQRTGHDTVMMFKNNSSRVLASSHVWACRGHGELPSSLESS